MGDYAENCKKYCFDYEKHVMHYPTDIEFVKNMTKSAQESGFVLIAGAIRVRKDEENEENEHFIPIVKNLVLECLADLDHERVGEIHAVFFSDKDSKGLNPKILRGLISGKWTLMPGGGVAVPGQLRPFSSLTLGAPDSNGYRKRSLRLNGGRFGNMQYYPEVITLRALGCVGLPDLVLDMPWTTKELGVHAPKVATAAFFSELRGEGVTEEECVENFKDFCNPSLTCKQQKEFGQKAKLSGVYFELTSNLSILIKVFIDCLQAYLDPSFWDFIMECKNLDIEIMESAIQGACDRFGGNFHDNGWGSGGGAQVCIPAHALSDGSKARGIFGQGVSCLFKAIQGDENTLQMLGLTTAIDKDNLAESCRIIFTNIWKGLEDANSKAPAAKAKKAEADKAKANAGAA